MNYTRLVHEPPVTLMSLPLIEGLKAQNTSVLYRYCAPHLYLTILSQNNDLLPCLCHVYINAVLHCVMSFEAITHHSIM